MTEHNRSYPCNTLGCDQPGAWWVQFGTAGPYSYCKEHFDAILRRKAEYEPRDEPVAVKGK